MVTPPPQRTEDQDIVALDEAALLLKACPDLLDLLRRKPSKRTFNPG